jgi:Ca2+-binding EF-hand superfamily protein
MKQVLGILATTAILVAGSASANADDGGWRKGHHRPGMRIFERTDTDKDGKITLEEVKAVIGERFRKVDADGDMVVTKAEIVAALESDKQHPRLVRHAGRIADRLVLRFDLNEDGSVTLEEIGNRAEKRFALLDRNDDGFVIAGEVDPIRGARRGMRRWFGRWHSHQHELREF